MRTWVTLGHLLGWVSLWLEGLEVEGRVQVLGNVHIMNYKPHFSKYTQNDVTTVLHSLSSFCKKQLYTTTRHPNSGNIWKPALGFWTVSVTWQDRLYKIWTVKVQFMNGSLDFKWLSKFWTLFDHSKSRLVRFSNPHCIFDGANSPLNQVYFHLPVCLMYCWTPVWNLVTI